MNESRLFNILNKVAEKYTHLPPDIAGNLIMNDVSAVIRGLYSREDFLRSFTIIGKMIICSKEEKLPLVIFTLFV